MKRAAGFTLIELVIVIVILGILGAVAAPRFFNLQGDAYAANMNALKSSIQSAMTMANAKALIDGKLDAAGDTVANSVKEYDFIEFVAGYPAANDTTEASSSSTGAGILATLSDLDVDRYTITEVAAAAGEPAKLTIAPKAVENPAKCMITYTQAVPAVTTGTTAPAKPATVAADTEGC